VNIKGSVVDGVSVQEEAHGLYAHVITSDDSGGRSDFQASKGWFDDNFT
jgi:hypothetical protein